MPKQRPGLILATLVLAGSLATPVALADTASYPPAAIQIVGDSGKTAPDGQPLDRFQARGIAPSLATPRVASPADTAPPECPPELMAHCQWLPAAYQQDDPADPGNYGNYDIASRPSVQLPIDTIVIHDTEGSLASAEAAFRNPTTYTSVQYIIDDASHTVVQMVRNKNVAWHAGNWDINQRSIGIEHVGHAATGGTDYTPWLYQTSAALVRWLTSQYHIPLDRQHIIGHDNVPGPTPAYTAGMHYDPAAFWNWQYYQLLLGMPVLPTAGPNSPLITMAPNWPINQPTVTQCNVGSPCTTLPKQSANFVYLHQSPSDAAPLLTDPALQADGRSGTTRIDDWSAKAVYGQQYAVAICGSGPCRQGDWVGIWFAGQVGWFKNLGGLLNAMPTKGQYIQPKAGLGSIPVYGRAYPEATAYAGTQVPVQSVVPIQYSITAGQRYATSGSVQPRYYWAWTIDSSLPDDHTVIAGHDTYVEIQYNERIAFVKRSDVDLVG